MTSNGERRLAILVVEAVEETRYGIERLLAASGYQVSTARDEKEVKASLHHPDLILISSLGLDAFQVVPTARRIRERAWREVAIRQSFPYYITVNSWRYVRYRTDATLELMQYVYCARLIRR